MNPGYGFAYFTWRTLRWPDLLHDEKSIHVPRTWKISDYREFAALQERKS